MLANKLVKINDLIWEIPLKTSPIMKVPARIFASQKLLNQIMQDRTLDQLINVSALPGIVGKAVLMPDAHEGYGFPIGGIAATSYPDGVISPGGIGYDINCGVRLIVTDLRYQEVKTVGDRLAQVLFHSIPSGVGRQGQVKLSSADINRVLVEGVDWVIANGYGRDLDKEVIESQGKLAQAEYTAVSEQAKQRGLRQLGTMGAGNHFVEVGRVADIYLPEAAQAFGLQEDQITILIHTGSRGLGHQVATDYIKLFLAEMHKYNINLPDRELAGVPLSTAAGQKYFAAMSAAANFAWANRQVITHLVRTSFVKVFGRAAGTMPIVYDVAHNIAKIEEYQIDSAKRKLIVHRKGATRAFPPFHPELPSFYSKVGQPVLIPGSMGTCSYVLVGVDEARERSFSSVCHGAGRVMSRRQAKKQIDFEKLTSQLKQQGIVITVGSKWGVVEEAPQAYKDVSEVIEVVDRVGLANKVARLEPWVVVKG